MTAVPPFRLTHPRRITKPIIFSSPHCGQHFPRRFLNQTRLGKDMLRRSEDSFVSELFDFAPDIGAPLIAATYARAYVDLNREAYEVDPEMFRDALPDFVNARSERVRAGFGTIPRLVTANTPIYEKKLDFAAERKARIDAIYERYHEALNQLVEDCRNSFGWAILVDCHSMPSLTALKRLSGYRVSSTLLADLSEDPDVVIGDRLGGSCDPAITDMVEQSFRDCGYSIRRNRPYAGGYCTKRFGRPEAGIHAIQIEINRRLYMDETALSRDAEGFERLRRDLRQIADRLAAYRPRIDRPIAAE